MCSKHQKIDLYRISAVGTSIKGWKPVGEKGGGLGCVRRLKWIVGGLGYFHCKLFIILEEYGMSALERLSWRPRSSKKWSLLLCMIVMPSLGCVEGWGAQCGLSSVPALVTCCRWWRGPRYMGGIALHGSPSRGHASWDWASSLTAPAPVKRGHQPLYLQQVQNTGCAEFTGGSPARGRMWWCAWETTCAPSCSLPFCGILQLQGFLSWKLICNFVFNSPWWNSATLFKHLCYGPFACPVARSSAVHAWCDRAGDVFQ